MEQALKDILSRVQKPGRYAGGETNSVRKEWTAGRLPVALAYPDTYEVGMSYLGLKILYHLLNERDDIVCERVFAPWDDMEKELAASGMKLFSLESKTELNRFAIVGFSLSYELTYTNVLNMLHLSGITVRSCERGEEEPLVIAGGACCYNPEPMSDFIDAFIIGDGEESLPEFIDEYRKLKNSSLDRKGILKVLAFLEGVYVPALYREVYREGRFFGVEPVDENIPASVKKTEIPDLGKAYYPLKQIVPLIKTVHDRMAVEVMRGCPNLCRFCQAAAVNRPVRLRTSGRVRQICRDTYENTGYERIALLSLSSVNYPYLTDVVKGLNEDFREKGVGLTIPSLRIDEAFYDLPEMISAIRKAGLTFAPETASEGMRKALGKDIDIQVLCRSALIAYRHGWQRLKLYFMVGFPGEPEDEAKKISEIAHELSRIRKKVSKGAAEVKVSVNPFVPKPDTPLQWLGMATGEYLSRVKGVLESSSSKKVKMEFHDIEQSTLEACMSRGGRRTGTVIYDAWREGAKMDSWGEFFDFSVWEGAFRDNGTDIYEGATKAYAPGDVLPWAHINAGPGEEWLKEEFEKSGLHVCAAAHHGKAADSDQDL